MLPMPSILYHKNVSYQSRKNEAWKPKNFQCTYCEYLTPHKGHWETHIRSQHENFKEPCSGCGKQFSNQSNVYRHKRKLHCKKAILNN